LQLKLIFGNLGKGKSMARQIKEICAAIDKAWIEFTVEGLPPSYDPASSIMNPRHRHYPRVQKLQAAAKKAMAGNKPLTRLIAMEIFYGINLGNPRMDAVNMIGGIANALQGIVYKDDNLIREVYYREWYTTDKDIYKIIVYELALEE